MEDSQELQEVLTPAQRRKMGLRMKILAKKPGFIMKRQRAMKRAANKETLTPKIVNEQRTSFEMYFNIDLNINQQFLDCVSSIVGA